MTGVPAGETADENKGEARGCGQTRVRKFFKNLQAIDPEENFLRSGRSGGGFHSLLRLKNVGFALPITRRSRSRERLAGNAVSPSLNG
jgi:hypothetical protein